MTSWDVVVVGAGNAALCAALAAREAEARVLVLEKAPKARRGGNSHFTDGAIRCAFHDLDELRSVMPWMSDEEAGALDVGSYPVEAYLDDLERMSGGRADPVLATLLAGRSLDTLRWMGRQGVRFVPVADNQSFERDGRRRFWGGLVVRADGRGIGLIQTLFERAERMGVDIRYDAPATELVVRGGAVTGIRVGSPRGEWVAAAGAVVLACGGFEADPVERVRYLGAEWEDAVVRGTPYNTGDGLALALEAGAARWGDWSGCHAVAMDVAAPASGDFDKPGDVWKKHSYPLGIVVNRDGRRFVDEGADFRNYTYARYGRELLSQPGRIAYQLFDAKVAPLLRSEYSRPDTTRVEAETLPELAAGLDIDREGLLTTVREFNDHVTEGPFSPDVLDGKAARGIDPPKSNWAQRIDRPPFLGFPVRCGITFTYGGVRVDGDARVLRETGEPVPGLYAAGEMVGGLFYDNYPGGSGLMSGSVFGRIAGAAAARDAMARARGGR